MPSRRIAATSLLLVVGAASTCATSWQGPVTDHFDGAHFVTPGAPQLQLGLLKWVTNRQRGPWKDWRDEPTGPRPPAHVGKGEMRVTFINHATTLIQLDGVNVLTDPIWSDRCSPVAFAGPKRVRPPGLALTDLPRIDAVVLSHNHYDHLDLPTLQRLQGLYPNVRLFAGAGNRALLEHAGLRNVTELDWWDSRELLGITVRSVPNQHFANRGLFDGATTLWTAWVLEGSAGRAYFAGDTAYGPHFALAAQRLGPMRLAVLPIGAYKPEWFMSPVHMSPTDAVRAALDLRATLAVPMHFGTFELADDGETEAADLVREQAPFVVLGFGEGRDVPREGVVR
jgi:L-ascorbate metabolism protein UlaG (beta-lactamase superfamily)